MIFKLYFYSCSAERCKQALTSEHSSANKQRITLMLQTAAAGHKSINKYESKLCFEHFPYLTCSCVQSKYVQCHFLTPKNKIHQYQTSCVFLLTLFFFTPSFCFLHLFVVLTLPHWSLYLVTFYVICWLPVVSPSSLMKLRTTAASAQSHQTDGWIENSKAFTLHTRVMFDIKLLSRKKSYINKLLTGKESETVQCL